MANPKRKHSKARKNRRRSHHAYDPIPVANCRQCGKAKTPHTICGFCGHYDKGKPVIAGKE